jgi:hypothetical protein
MLPTSAEGMVALRRLLRELIGSTHAAATAPRAAPRAAALAPASSGGEGTAAGGGAAADTVAAAAAAAAAPFAPDLIIANRITYAHTHLAEALGARLHLLSCFPWRVSRRRRRRRRLFRSQTPA